MNKQLKYLINIMGPLLFCVSIQGAYSMQPIKYDIGYKSYNTKCAIYVNGAKALANYKRKGPVMAGLTMSAFLENGTNTVALEMAPFTGKDGDKSYQADAVCELKVSKIIVHERSEDELELFKLVGSVDENLKPTGNTSPDYDEHTIKEQPVKGTELYMVSKSFEISGLPEWTWTKATPFEPSEKNMEKLRQAYLEVWQAINTKNEARFKELSHISFSEKEIATNYPGAWHVSLGLHKYFKIISGAMPINWDEYELVLLNKGRLVKLENSKGFSPLGFRNQEGKFITSYNPYFSLIDGSMIITR